MIIEVKLLESKFFLLAFNFGVSPGERRGSQLRWMAAIMEESNRGSERAREGAFIFRRKQKADGRGECVSPFFACGGLWRGGVDRSEEQRLYSQRVPKTSGGDNSQVSRPGGCGSRGYGRNGNRIESDPEMNCGAIWLRDPSSLHFTSSGWLSSLTELKQS